MFRFFRRTRVSAVPAAIILVAGLIGMVDSFYLLLEYLQVLMHPGETTPCTVNSIISCTLTVQGPWGHYFTGIPNPMWGMLWYSGVTGYGATRLLGAEFGRKARLFVGAVLLMGLLFSYRLYLASVLDLGGVCPFCLTSTTASTLILLAFGVDDRSYADSFVRGWVRACLHVFQGFSVVAFVIGLPLFLARGLSFIPDPGEVMRHWSFPTIVILVFAMACGHAWAFRRLRKD